MRNSSCCAHALKQPEVRVEEAQLLIVRGSGGLVVCVTFLSLVKCVCVAFVAIAGRGYTYTVCTHRNYLLTSHRSRLHAQGTLPSERTPDLFLFSRLIFRQKVNRRRGLAADFGLDDVPPRGHSRSRRRHVGAVLHFGLLGHAIGHNIDQRFRFWRLGNL